MIDSTKRQGWNSYAMDHTIVLSPTAIGYEMNPLDTGVLRRRHDTREQRYRGEGDEDAMINIYS